MRRLLFSLLAVCGLALGVGAAHASSADARFKALYDKEWAWREAEFPGADDEDRGGRGGDEGGWTARTHVELHEIRRLTLVVRESRTRTG